MPRPYERSPTRRKGLAPRPRRIRHLRFALFFPAFPESFFCVPAGSSAPALGYNSRAASSGVPPRRAFPCRREEPAVKTAALAASAVALLLLAGCASTGTVTWSKPGIDMTQGTKDLEACASQANYIYPQPMAGEGKVDTGRLFDVPTMDGNFEKCMTGKGYRRN